MSLWDRDSTFNQKSYRPPGEGLEHHIYAPKGPETLPKQQPGCYMYGQWSLPLPPSRNTSPGWYEDEGNPVADSDTLPARWRNEAHPAQKGKPDANQGQSTAKRPKLHFQRPSDSGDDGSQGSESSLGNSLEGSMVNIEKDESRPDDRSRDISSYTDDAFDYEGSSSGDENGYVHISRGSRCGRVLERVELSL